MLTQMGLTSTLPPALYTNELACLRCVVLVSVELISLSTL
jgi:hypothetical protein